MNEIKKKLNKIKFYLIMLEEISKEDFFKKSLILTISELEDLKEMLEEYARTR